jgi:hypothetical protein
MITVQSDLKIEVNAKEITLRNEGDLLLLQFPDWSTYKIFRNSLPAKGEKAIKVISNRWLLSIGGRDAIAINARGSIGIKSLYLAIRMGLFELYRKLKS